MSESQTAEKPARAQPKPPLTPEQALMVCEKYVEAVRQLHADMGKKADEHRDSDPKDVFGASTLYSRQKGVGKSLQLFLDISNSVRS